MKSSPWLALLLILSIASVPTCKSLDHPSTNILHQDQDLDDPRELFATLLTQETPPAYKYLLLKQEAFWRAAPRSNSLAFLGLDGRDHGSNPPEDLNQFFITPRHNNSYGRYAVRIQNTLNDLTLRQTVTIAESKNLAHLVAPEQTVQINLDGFVQDGKKKFDRHLAKILRSLKGLQFAQHRPPHWRRQIHHFLFPTAYAEFDTLLVAAAGFSTLVSWAIAKGTVSFVFKKLLKDQPKKKKAISIVTAIVVVSTLSGLAHFNQSTAEKASSLLTATHQEESNLRKTEKYLIPMSTENLSAQLTQLSADLESARGEQQNVPAIQQQRTASEDFSLSSLRENPAMCALLADEIERQTEN